MTFIQIATRNGFTLETDGNTLFVTPASKLTEAWRETIKRHKLDLLPHLPPNQHPFVDERFQIIRRPPRR